MRDYLVDRILLTTLPTLFVIGVFAFALTHTLVPSSTKAEIAREYGDARRPEAVRRINHDLGWHHNTPSQFAHWLGISWFLGGPKGVLEGEFGTSLFSERPLWPTIKFRLAQTLEEVTLAQIFVVTASLPLAAIAVRFRGRWPDRCVGALTRLMLFPGIILGIYWILFGTIWFHWTRSGGYHTFAQDPISNLWILAVPCLFMALLPMGIFVRLAQHEILDATQSRSLESSESWRPAITSKRIRLRHALVPLVLATAASMQLLLAIAMLYEYFFFVPGIGYMTLQAIGSYEYPALASLILVLAGVCVLLSRMAELVCAFLMSASVHSTAEWRAVSLRNSMYGSGSLPKRISSRD